MNDGSSQGDTDQQGVQLLDVAAVVIFADDPEQLADWYQGQLQVRRVVSQPGFIGLRAARITLFIQRTSEGHRPGMGGIRPHFVVRDCRAAFDRLIQGGATQILPVTDLGAEVIAAVQDPEGNPLGLLQPRS